MKALTLWPAEILGVDKQLGSIENGKIANVIVTDGSPLALTTHVKHVIIHGREVSLDNRHLACTRNTARVRRATPRRRPARPRTPAEVTRAAVREGDAALLRGHVHIDLRLS
jgi:cytosine/adenosine deaminase-related metal-dependent hydrolase